MGGDGAGAGADPAVLAAVLADARLPLAAGTAPNRQSYAEAAMAAAAAAKAAHDDATHALRRCALLRFARAARLFLWPKTGLSAMKTPGIEQIDAPPAAFMQDPCSEGFQ